MTSDTPPTGGARRPVAGPCARRGREDFPLPASFEHPWGSIEPGVPRGGVEQRA